MLYIRYIYTFYICTKLFLDLQLTSLYFIFLKIIIFQINPDSIIYRLLKQDQEQIAEHEIIQLIDAAYNIFLQQPSYLELNAPVKIVGDIHGQFTDLIRLFQYSGFPPGANYLFLGDYVDRGEQSIEVITLLLCYKIKYPETFLMQRGNHEISSINRIYGFYQECKSKYSIELYKKFKQLFDVLPLASCIEDKIFCVHGGISPQLENTQQLRNIIRPTSIPDQGLLCDLLWADPQRDIDGFYENDRGVSYIFGAKQVEQMLRRFQCDLIVRAHQVVDNGYEFFAQRRLVTIFSAPHYCNTYDNAGAIMNVDQSLMCSFQVLIAQNQQQSQYQQVE